ncbi:hypothetical protein [Streptomyces beijiangensis]|uniref:Sortase n=1 Tax=Streptomyces beijiangensis TaxID=163361 RepID=A0A939JKA3_9ACTN|nr:hypothetical protein [Streptomyces beijiangensis]MBO0515090.1 hypothetical protein [Streptomyces beijiangensis]
MRIFRVTFCAAAIAAAALLPVTAAGAATGDSESTGSVTVTPSVIAPGGVADLRVSVCSGEKAVGTSDAFVSEAQFAPAADGGLFAEMKVRSDASAKEFPITVKCQDSAGTASGIITVVRSSATPVAPVHAGGGGAALLAAQGAHEEGPGTRHAVIGLVLAGVAAVAVAGRSVRRRRQGSA